MMPPKISHPTTLLIALLTTAALAPKASAEETLGRLFFTPERRQALDRQRQLNIQDTQEINQDPRLTINGIVTRSSGKRTSWINGGAQNENEIAGGITVTPRVRDPGKVLVETSDSPAANARVGDTVNRGTGESKSLLNDGRIVVNPAITKK